VTGACDPNAKHVQPQGRGPQGFIAETDSLMRYFIEFQNTGNDTAFYVVLRDTISQHLNVRSYQPQGESFPYTLRVEQDSILVFTFAHINVPDSNRNEPGSHGYVGCSLTHKGSLAPGSATRNRAAIYFDFNAPIFTNEVVNTIQAKPNGLHPVRTEAPALTVVPNPLRDRADLRLALPDGILYENLSVGIADVSGRVVLTLPLVHGQASLVRGSLAAGLCIATVRGAAFVAAAKVVVE